MSSTITGLCEQCGKLKRIKFVSPIWICKSCQKGNEQ